MSLATLRFDTKQLCELLILCMRTAFCIPEMLLVSRRNKENLLNGINGQYNVLLGC